MSVPDFTTTSLLDARHWFGERGYEIQGRVAHDGCFVSATRIGEPENEFPALMGGEFNSAQHLRTMAECLADVARQIVEAKP